jgi:hypothetical protein
MFDIVSDKLSWIMYISIKIKKEGVRSKELYWNYILYILSS